MVVLISWSITSRYSFLILLCTCSGDDAFEHTYDRVGGDDVDGNIIGDVVIVGNDVFTAMLEVRGSLDVELADSGSPA